MNQLPDRVTNKGSRFLDQWKLAGDDCAPFQVPGAALSLFFSLTYIEMTFWVFFFTIRPVAANRCNYQCIARNSQGSSVSLLAFNKEGSCNYQYVVLKIDEGKTIVTRDQMVDILQGLVNWVSAIEALLNS
ncbi:MAG: hypothetical protein QOG23_2228 [Blastocatellia bacterium]|jgi:hypothetical protein|nr:hypothetical protein [Blastocatellia bacterium]